MAATTSERSQVFVATDTTLTPHVNAAKQSGGSSVIFGASAILEELPDHTATTKWDVAGP